MTDSNEFVFDICLSDNNCQKVFFKDLNNSKQVLSIIDDFCFKHSLNDLQKSAIFQIIENYKQKPFFDSLESFYSIEKVENEDNKEINIKKKTISLINKNPLIPIINNQIKIRKMKNNGTSEREENKEKLKLFSEIKQSKLKR